MKTGLTEIVYIIDMSGSMGAVREDAVGGFNRFVEDQKKEPSEARLTAVFFNSQAYTLWRLSVDIQNIPPLGNEYSPDGMTPLLDAIGRTVNEVGQRLDKLPDEEKPERVLVIIMTDGLENASKEFKKDQIRQMIEHQRTKYNWEFVFAGANMDATAEARGLCVAQAVHYKSTGKGVRDAYKLLCRAASNYRISGKTGLE